MAVSSMPPGAKNGVASAAARERAFEGRVNGSLGNGRGRVNGSRAAEDRGKTNGASLRTGSSLRRVRQRRPKAGAIAAVLALLLPAVLFLAAPGGAARFAADGDFREWEGVPGVADAASPGEPASPDLQEVRVEAQARTVFVYAAAREGWFAGGSERVVRVFLDADRSTETGFDLGGIGADMMIEAAGSSGRVSGSGSFLFEGGRAQDDWHGWTRDGRGSIAVRGSLLEAALPAWGESGPRVMVAVSGADGDDLQDPPSGPAGALVAEQSSRAAQVLAPGDFDVPLVDVSLSTAGRAAQVHALTFVPTGGADFSVLATSRLVAGGGADFEPTSASPEAITFTFVPPLDLPVGAVIQATLRASFVATRDFDGDAGRSLGARLAAADTGDSGPALALTPRTLAPSSYLGFVSPTPAIDGAFGEWKLAGAAADPVDADAAPGSDLVGVRAMTAGASGAFFAETRGPILAGASLGDLPVTVTMVAEGGPAGSKTPSAPQPAPPLSADDRLLVYLDTDRDPTTGFEPAIGGPVGAEFVIQVSGRFSHVANAHLLKFAGASPYDSAWTPVGALNASAVGADLEGEIPSVVFEATGAARVLIQTVAWNGRTDDLSDVLQDAALDPIDPDTLLHFQSVTFDPLAGKPAVRPALLTDGPNGFWVVQLREEPAAGDLAALESAGAKLFGYVHSNAYLAKMDEATADAIRGMAAVRWVGTYEPAFKFASDPATWGAGPFGLTALLFERPDDLEARVKALGVDVVASSESALRVLAPQSSVESLAFVPEIQFIAPENRRVPLNDIGRSVHGVDLAVSRYALNGSGIVVGISDSGIDFTHPAFDDSGTTSPNFDGRIVGYFKYAGSYGDTDGHGTHTAGSVAGDGDLSSTVNSSIPGVGSNSFHGMAPAAKIVETAIFNGGTPGDDGVFANQEAFGATVSSNSWGYVDNLQKPITDYTVSSYLTDLSVIDSNTSKSGYQPMTILFAAGNDGNGSDTAGDPATSKNVIVVGASESNRGYDDWGDNLTDIAVFSSRGPTDDGRIRPDVVAIGTWVLSTQSRTSGCGCTYGGWDTAATGANYAFSGGTSMATPMVAGMVALFQQHINQTYGHIPSPALVKAALINGAEDLGYGFEFTGGVTGPMSQGWGRVNITRSIDGPPNGTILLYDEGADISSGDVAVRRFSVSNASTPLKVTAVWTDAPGNPSDTKTLAELVNDLDLVVRAPNGTFYHGNQFGGSWSRGNNSSFDRKNNVENVFVQTPTAGTWTVEVSGFLLKSAEQRFALAVSGNLSESAPVSVSDAHAVPGAPAGAKFGWNATASGSINGDAYRDLVVGAPGANGGNGSVYVFLGGAAKTFTAFNVSNADIVLNGTGAEGFGSSVDASGDFDGDGKADLLVGAPAGGKAYLFKGSASWTSRTADVTFNGSSSGRFGTAVRLAAVDSSGGAEALIGEPLSSNSTGAVYLFTGGAATGTWNASSANATFTGPGNGSRFGTSISTGDADGDSKLDIAIGAPGASVVKLIHGGAAASSLAVNATVTGLPGTAFGQSISLEGDHNGDGKSDLLVGAPGANGTAGAGYVFFGRSPLANDQVLKTYFYDDMEDGVGFWQEMSGTTNTTTPWDLTTAQNFGPTAGHSWQDSTGSYSNNKDYSIAFSSGINLSAATSPALTFVYKADLEGTATNFDGFVVLYSVNSGSSWIQVDSTNAQGQYDTTAASGGGGSAVIGGLKAFTYDSPTWRQVTFNVSSLAGNSSVKFRFQFATDNGATGDGVYIDNVAVREARPSSPNYTVYGESAGDALGYAVASLGDANGDGRAEFAFGAPTSSSGLTYQAGAAYVFKGSSSLNGSTPALSADEVLRGSDPSASLGFSLTAVSSFNGSSQTFLFAGEPGLASGSGGGSVGNASAPIPEFSDLALPVAGVALFALVGRRRKRAK